MIKKGLLEIVKYKTTSTSEDQMEDLFSQVQTIIVEDKQFMNGDISLKTLSKQLNLTSQTLSMVINSQTKMNFNAYINKYRIEEVIRMMKDEKYKEYTIASISYEAGFNSISSFNTAFKQHTQNTPKAYREKLNK